MSTKVKSSYCPHCDRTGFNILFCGNCGKPMQQSETKACPSCDCYVGNDQNFCYDCGTPLLDLQE